MDIQDIKTWDQRLQDQVRCRWENYLVRTIDLSIARTNEIFVLAGEKFIVQAVSDSGVTATVRLNRDNNDELKLVDGLEIETMFGQFFISNTAQADEWIDIIIGVNFKYQKTGQGAGGGGGTILANNEIQITWSAANSQSIAATANATSDVFAFSTNGSFAHIQLKADNNGTPAAGDTVSFFLLLTCGDPDGAGADEYDTINHAIPLGTLDTNSEDPALRTVNCPMVKGGKLYAVNNSAGRAITVSACILEKTVS